MKKTVNKTHALIPAKQKALDATLAAITKKFGNTAVRRMGDTTSVNVDSVPTGFLGLDYILGCGGWPRGRIIEVYGAESSGKTTLALHCVSAVQQAGGSALYIDAEHALDIVYAESLGVNVQNLYLSQPDYGEQALQLVEEGLSGFDVIIIDSVAALTPKTELDGEIGDAHVGLQARMMSQALRKLVSDVKKSNALVFFINQTRTKIGVSFGDPETTTGGNALKFYSSVRLKIWRSGKAVDGQERVGDGVKIRAVKNKLAPPFREIQMESYYGTGLSKEAEVLEYGLEHGLFTKSGSWYSMGDERIGQGKNKTMDFLRENPEIVEEFQQKVFKMRFQQPDPNANDSLLEESSDESQKEDE